MSLNLEGPHLHHHTDGESSAAPATVQMATTTITPSVKHNTSITKRPRLSLQTSPLPISCGQESASPTVRNTFNNTFVTRPLSAGENPSPTKPSNRCSRYGSPYPFSFRSDNSVPYQLPLGVRSILRNSPLAKSIRPSLSMTASGVPESRHVYFPAKKQVSYRFPLEEEIQTVRFVARHSDLSSDSESESGEESESDDGSDSSIPVSEDQSSSGEEEEEDKPEVAERSPQAQSRRKRRKSLPSERQIRAAALRDGLDEERYTPWSTPTTPRQSRRKRRCKWRWTLGDLASESDSTAEKGSTQNEPADRQDPSR